MPILSVSVVKEQEPDEPTESFLIVVVGRSDEGVTSAVMESTVLPEDVADTLTTIINDNYLVWGVDQIV